MVTRGRQFQIQISPVALLKLSLQVIDLSFEFCRLRLHIAFVVVVDLLDRLLRCLGAVHLPERLHSASLWLAAGGP